MPAGPALMLLVTCGLSIAPFVFQRGWDRAAAPGPPPAPESAPVILIVLDTLRADHLGAYGSDQGLTPSIDQLASHSTVYEYAISTSPWTAPAHASIVTGLLPSRHGVRLRRGASGSSLNLASNFESLGEMFRSGGYETVGVVANPWLAADHGYAEGFAHYRDDAPLTPFKEPAIWNLVSALGRYESLRFLTDPVRRRAHGWFKPYVAADAIFASALELLDQLDPERPPFLFLNLMDAHDPFEAPPPFSRVAGPEPALRISYHEVVRDAFRESRLSPAHVEQIRTTYAGEIAYLDFQLGRFLAELDARGLYDPSWIVITSDHGEHLGENGLLWHRTSLYDPLVNVPLIIKAPGQKRARRESSLVQSMDIYPSLLQSNGLDAPPGLDAVPLDAGRSIAISELYSDDWGEEQLGPRFGRVLRAASSSEGRLIGANDGSLEYVDRGSVEPTRFDDSETLPTRLQDLRAHLGDLHSAASEVDTQSSGVPPSSGMSEERLRQLRALGYAQ